MRIIVCLIWVLCLSACSSWGANQHDDVSLKPITMPRGVALKQAKAYYPVPKLSSQAPQGAVDITPPGAVATKIK